jgi:hypothetical protein
MPSCQMLIVEWCYLCLCSSLDFDLTTILTIFCFAVHICRPITRTVSDAVHVLEAIVCYDPRDAEATRMAS